MRDGCPRLATRPLALRTFQQSRSLLRPRCWPRAGGEETRPRRYWDPRRYRPGRPARSQGRAPDAFAPSGRIRGRSRGRRRPTRRRRVASALEEQEVRNPLPSQPIPSREGRAASERDPHLAAIEQLLATPAAERLDAAERYQRERPLITASAAPAAPAPSSAPVRSQPARTPRPSPGDATIPTVRSSRPGPGDSVRTVRSPRPSPGDATIPTVALPHGVWAPRHNREEDEQRQRVQVAREAAERARQQAERRRGPRQGAEEAGRGRVGAGS
jgi:hypothetical protein